MRALLFAISSLLLAVVAAPIDASADRWHRGHGHGHHHRHHHGGWGPRVSIGVGPGWWWGPGVYVGAPYRPYRPYYAYGPYPYWAPPARVVVEDPEPPVYVERGDDGPPESNWYYCESRRAYYPKVETCPERWIPVPANDR